MPKTLLLADDSVTIQKVVSITFADEDVTLITVDNGDEAIARARESKPDLILADVVMPGKNGYEVCEAVKADPRLKNIPVVLLSGTFEPFDESRASRIQADGHITKPFESQALVETVRQLLEEPPAAEPAAIVDEGDPCDEEAVVAEADTAFDFLEADLEDEPAGSASTVLDPLATGAPEFGDDALTQFTSELGDSLETTSGDLLGVGESGTPNAAPGVPALDAPGARPEADSEEVAVAELDPGPDTTGSGFDFELGEGAEADDAGPLEFAGIADPVVPEDFMRETLVNPVVSDSFAVSSSDLGEPVAPEVDPLAATDPDLSDPGEAPVEEPTGNLSPLQDDFGDELDSVPDVRPDFAAPRALADRSEASHGDSSPSPAAGAPDLSPLLAQQLHETLEKIAWESFGELPERIVPQILERVEAIAWEVIPRMAETLILEEIRRLKDKS